MIEFNKPCRLGVEAEFVNDVIESGHMCGGGLYSKKCEQLFEEWLGSEACLLTSSCTASLEIAALLLDIGPNDEVIMPSYTFVSTANAFVLRGAKAIFVDVRPDTLNINEEVIEAAISKKTKAIVVVHYAGVGCNMPAIMELAEKYGIAVIEDAAQCVDSYLNGKPLGSFGDLAAFSFHETKNVTSGGEGGLLAINDADLVKRAEIIREKGTNRNAFFRGEVDKYTWVNLGSSYLPSELQAAYLYAQLQNIELVTKKREVIWRSYFDSFKAFHNSGEIVLPQIPESCQHNYHIFYMLVPVRIRDAMLQELKSRGVAATFHYLPLHSSEPGRKYGSFRGSDDYTTELSNRIVRLPIWYGMSHEMVQKVIDDTVVVLKELL